MVGGVCLTGDTLARKEEPTPGADATSREAILQVLDGIILGKDAIHGRHTSRIRKGVSAPWYYTSRQRASFDAAEFFTHHGSTANLVNLVRSDQHATTLEDLQDFLEKTPLTECNKGRVENAINRLEELPDSAAVKAELATTYSTGTGMTGELTAMIAAETATTGGNFATIVTRGGRRRLRSGQ